MSELPTATTTSFGDELRALQVNPTTQPLDAWYTETLTTIFRESESFIRMSCRHIAALYTKQAATFYIENDFMTGTRIRCDETKITHRLGEFNYKRFQEAWKNDKRLRRRALRLLKTTFDANLSYECSEFSVKFIIDWKAPPPPTQREPTIPERFEELKQLILTLPPVAGGHDYVAAAERFAQASASTSAATSKTSPPPKRRRFDEPLE